MTADHRHLCTDRLRLDAVTAADLGPMFELHSDPEVWRHLPAGRHVDPAQTSSLIAGARAGWEDDGLGYWAVRTREDIVPNPNQLPAGTFVGVGGCARLLDVVWNIYYRLTPAAWGRGFAGEIARAGRSAAARVTPELPVVAYLLEHNVASKRTAERAGLTVVWSGPDSGNPDPTAIRLLYSDRPLAGDLIEDLARHS